MTALPNIERARPSAAAAATPGPTRELARALLALTKPRIVTLLLVTTVPTMLLAKRGMPPGLVLAATLAGGALAAGGANALNMVFDRDIDAAMSRTRHRPLVTGVIAPRTATLFALALEVTAFALLYVMANLLAALLAVGAAAFYVGIYTLLLKRSTSQNIVIGGAAGAAPVLVGWAAVTGRLSPVAWALFAVIFVWTPPHFWALALRLRHDYASARVPMLPAVASPDKVARQIVGYAIALGVVAIAVGPLGGLGPLYGVGAAALSGVFVGKAWLLRQNPSPQRAIRLFRYSIVYLTVLFVLVGVAALAP